MHRTGPQGSSGSDPETVSSVGRAPGCYPGGRGFKSCTTDPFKGFLIGAAECSSVERSSRIPHSGVLVAPASVLASDRLSSTGTTQRHCNARLVVGVDNSAPNRRRPRRSRSGAAVLDELGCFRRRGSAWQRQDPTPYGRRPNTLSRGDRATCARLFFCCQTLSTARVGRQPSRL